MLKRRSKHFALLLVLTMLATMFVGVGTASAKSVNSASRVIAVDTDFNAAVGSTITIKENSDFVNDFVAGDTFKATLPDGVKWVSANTTINFVNGGTGVITAAVIDTSGAFKRTDQVMEIVLPAAMINTTNVDRIEITPGIEVTSATGDIALTIDPIDSAVTGQTVVFATVTAGKTTATVSSVKKVGRTNAVGGVIEIKENAVGSIDTTGNATITLKLPSNWEFSGMVAGDVDFAGGLSATGAATLSAMGDRNLTITFTPVAGTSRGLIYITPKFTGSSDVAKGDVAITVTGTDNVGNSIVDTDLIVANYVDYGTTVEVAEVKELKAGKFNQETAKITIKENVAGSLLTGRALTIDLPDWVKVTDLVSLTATGATDNTTRIPNRPDGTKTYQEIVINNTGASATTSKGEIELKLELSIQGDKTGDIEATISGAGATEQKIVIAKVAPSIATEATAADLKVGVQSQALKDIVITEGIKGIITNETWINAAGSAAKATNGVITVELTEGVAWAATPKVEVLSGNLEFKSEISYNGGVLTLPIKSASTSVAKIKISDCKVTLDRSVPEGPIYAKIKGSGIIENSKASFGFYRDAPPTAANVGVGAAETVDEGEFDVATAAKVQVGTVITAAPGEINKTAAFVIGAATYKLNGVDQTMDVAPYIKDSRTYMPIRYVGYALGITDANMLWDGAANTVTMMKGDKVVQLKIGSKTIMINGAAVTMDVAPEISNSRTMLPISFVANAFGYTATWDAATQTVSLK